MEAIEAQVLAEAMGVWVGLEALAAAGDSLVLEDLEWSARLAGMGFLEDLVMYRSYVSVILLIVKGLASKLQ